MKILFISDIHGISRNLKFIENVIKKQKIDKLVCLGDLYYAGPSYDNKYTVNSKEVHTFLTKYQEILICMKGNCDSSVDIKSSDFPINDGISLINTDGLDIYITHGNEYSYEKDRKFNRKGILVYGHEHIPSIKTKNNMVFINTGSISLPKNNIESYVIYENKKFVVYDINNNIIDEKMIQNY
ncbi:MAG: phosphodiesterase [Bacilli bacterium]